MSPRCLQQRLARMREEPASKEAVQIGKEGDAYEWEGSVLVQSTLPWPQAA